ncbi:MAG: rhomboid family intramembrane serine protease [Bacteroidetes bacterium]|nr:MAG: rhomboid family intramembrane serine protease [Bacteroidota bacterium]
MIPLRDTNPSQTTPVVNYLIIGLNVLVFATQFLMGDFGEELYYYFGVVPARITGAIEYGDVAPISFITLFTSMFLHGGLWHLLGNMLFLYVFGDNIEDRLGHFRYLVFYLIAGIAAAGTQVFINPASEIPMVGASGAIAGVLGAYILLYPTARISTLIPLIIIFQVIELPAFIFLGLWFAMQIFSGVMSLGIGGDAGGVAWWAHIGGFAAGAVMLPVMKKRRRW